MYSFPRLKRSLRAARHERSLRATRHQRRGAIAVLSAVLIAFLLVMVAFAIDVGMISVSRTEMQRCADSAALAAADELLHQTMTRGALDAAALRAVSPVLQRTAGQFAGLNEVSRQALQLGGAANGVVAGEYVEGADGTASLKFASISRYNSVAVQVERSRGLNGEVTLFFGRILGQDSVAMSASAQAAFLQDFRGFQVPSGKGDPEPTLMILPLAVEKSAWENAQNGTGPDDYTWDNDRKQVEPGNDGIRELNLYPLSTGASGNFGTVDIGSNNSNTPTLRRQIVSGATRADLQFHGGSLTLNDAGELTLSGDPGLKAGAIRSALESIIGQPRIVPLYRSVTGKGQNAQYTITGFGGGRIVAVNLRGSNKYVRMQSAPLITRGGIPGNSGSTQIYSPVVLVR